MSASSLAYIVLFLVEIVSFEGVDKNNPHERCSIGTRLASAKYNENENSDEFKPNKKVYCCELEIRKNKMEVMDFASHLVRQK